MAGHVITGAKFKYQKQKHTEALLGFFIYGLCISLGGEELLWGDEESWGRGEIRGSPGGRVGSGTVLDIIPYLHIHA
jgi:hypothetical protein